VDEAQELSEMAWRLLARRCPARSMTVVGDITQTSSAAGTISWERVLEPLAGDQWRLARLTVNYRTPAEIMAVTAPLLAAIDPGQPPPRAVRETGVTPWRMAAARDALPAALARLTVAEAAHGGRLAVIVPDARVAELGDAVARAVPDVSFGDSPDLTSPVVLLGARQAKGLEFDAMLIADPAAILTGSPRGLGDLYVAMTRATQRLGVLHPGPPPAELAALSARGTERDLPLSGVRHHGLTLRSDVPGSRARARVTYAAIAVGSSAGCRRAAASLAVVSTPAAARAARRRSARSRPATVDSMPGGRSPGS
jgi:hypothetical protein